MKFKNRIIRGEQQINTIEENHNHKKTLPISADSHRKWTGLKNDKK